MERFFLITISLFLLLACKTEKPPKVLNNKADLTGNIEIVNKIDSLARALVANKQTAGITYGIQVGNQKPVIKAYGLSNIEENKILFSSGLFRIASITKPITATAIFKLIEAGKLSLDEPISGFFPNFPDGNNITIYHLLSHTSGIPNWWEGGLPEGTPADFPMCDSTFKYLQAMKTVSLFSPGSYYSYSNSGYVLLGEIIEMVSGSTYEGFLQEQIFNPLNIKNIEMEYIERAPKEWVKGYAINDSNGVNFTEPMVYHMPFSAGGLRANAEGLLQFSKALFSGRLVNKDLVNKMASCSLLKNGNPVYEGYFQVPGQGPPKPQENVKENGYGLGFNVMKLNDVPVIYHSGGIAGFNSMLMYIPQNNTTLVLLANTENGFIPQWKSIRQLAMEIKNIE